MRLVREAIAGCPKHLIDRRLRVMTKSGLRVHVHHQLEVDAAAHAATARGPGTGNEHDATATGPAQSDRICGKLLAQACRQIEVATPQVTVEERLAAVQRFRHPDPRIAGPCGIVCAATGIPCADDVARKQRIQRTAGLVVLHGGNATIETGGGRADDVRILVDGTGRCRRLCIGVADQEYGHDRDHSRGSTRGVGKHELPPTGTDTTRVRQCPGSL